jgi:hypothetical protein
MNLPSGDVNALLASLRYRLQRRIAQAGLTVDWQVDELPHWEQALTRRCGICSSCCWKRSPMRFSTRRLRR